MLKTTNLKPLIIFLQYNFKIIFIPAQFNLKRTYLYKLFNYKIFNTKKIDTNNVKDLI